MAWTTPRTWANNETVNDTIMNAHVRDNLNYLYDPGDWVSFTPTVSGFTSVTYTATGYYQFVNQSTVVARMTVTINTVTTLGSSTITVSLPTSAKTTGQTAGLSPIGVAIYDPAAANPTVGAAVYQSSTTLGVLLPNATAPRASTWTGAAPSGQVANDVWFFQVTYEVA